MKRGAKMFLYLLPIVALIPLVRATSNDSAVSSPQADSVSDNPYSAIWLRNVFDLKPTPPPSAAPEPTNAPPPGVKLIGLADYAHVKMAMFLVTRQPEPGKPSPNLETSCMLREGERKDIGSTGSGLEVVEIDLPGKKAMIKLQGVLSPINLETNKPAGGGAPGGHMAGGRANSPSGVNPAGAAYNNNGAPPPNPNRQNRVPGNPNAQYSPQNNGVQPTYLNGGYNGATSGSTPGLSLPGSSTSPSALPASQQAVDPAITAAIVAAQQALAQQQGKPFPPLPPGMIPSLDPNEGSQPGSPPSLVPTAPPLGSKTTGKFVLPPVP